MLAGVITALNIDTVARLPVKRLGLDNCVGFAPELPALSGRPGSVATVSENERNIIQSVSAGMWSDIKMTSIRKGDSRVHMPERR
jgi:hypothetical protein